MGWVALAGLVAGVLAGLGARFGRICTMGATEDLIVSGDGRGARMLGFALGIAILLTHGGQMLGIVDLSTSLYRNSEVDLLAVVLGGLLFGLGMAFVGTCSFGLLVRAGTGDLRAMMSASVVGVIAFAFTSGVLSPLRDVVSGVGVIDFRPVGGPALTGMIAATAGPFVAHLATIGIGLTLVAAIVFDRSPLRAWRVVLGAALIGSAITLGWIATSAAVDRLDLSRVESLSFVAPIGRMLLQVMIEPMRGVEFGVGAVAGVALGAFAVAAIKDELRWEAFDDDREMRRHLLGAALMGIGGVLARGCTIGQGLTAGSTLAITMPCFVIALLLGAKVGLDYLLEGRLPWAFQSRASSR